MSYELIGGASVGVRDFGGVRSTCRANVRAAEFAASLRYFISRPESAAALSPDFSCSAN
ncbi:MAG TPA: hypothetical protein VK400_04130 [Pyrinomonadaceae bacterium]|nr:hypothetical protein [Pyrinomonadaceae bacterium]